MGCISTVLIYVHGNCAWVARNSRMLGIQKNDFLVDISYGSVDDVLACTVPCAGDMEGFRAPAFGTLDRSTVCLVARPSACIAFLYSQMGLQIMA